jgi:hypothetical protein
VAKLGARQQKERQFESFSNNVFNFMIGVINQHDLKKTSGVIDLSRAVDMKTVLTPRVSRVLTLWDVR